MVLFYETFVKEKLFSMVFGDGGVRGPESSQTEYKGRTKEKIDCQVTANTMRGEGERSHNNITCWMIR